MLLECINIKFSAIVHVLTDLPTWGLGDTSPSPFEIISTHRFSNNDKFRMQKKLFSIIH